MAINLRAPIRIGHIGPILLFKSGSVAEPVLVNVEHRDLLGQIETQCFPGNREMPVAQAEEAAERQDRVGEPVISGVKDDVLDSP